MTKFVATNLFDMDAFREEELALTLQALRSILDTQAITENEYFRGCIAIASQYLGEGDFLAALATASIPTIRYYSETLTVQMAEDPNFALIVTNLATKIGRYKGLGGDLAVNCPPAEA